MSIRKLSWPPAAVLAPVPPVLIGSGDGKLFRYNLMTAAWSAMACTKPPIVSVAIRPERYSYEIIRKLGAFTVNLPTVALAADVDWCGVVSGRDHDKFAERRLVALPGEKVAAPSVEACPLSLECTVLEVLELEGSHHLFLGKVVGVRVSENFVDEKGRLALEKAGLLAYAHGHYYALGRCLGHFGYSVRRKKGSVVRK
ncbi:MAG: flavin reductase family protein [Victivallaceae bacterium]|nr:flavin reductase family protein [Victivallaceae bacterium]